MSLDEMTESVLKTKKKTFVSDINPHLVKRNFQKEHFVWFGVYDTLLRNKNICALLKNCKDTTLPHECAAIHLENYEMYFGKTKSNCVRALINESKDSVIFIKLYLISKEQFLDILSVYYNIESNHFQDSLFQKLNKIGNFECFPNSSTEFGKVSCVGELDNILIYSVTSQAKLEVGSPNTEYLRNIYLGLKKTFSPYSEYLIMYYIYRIEGVRNFYTIQQLKECFFKIKQDQTVSEDNSQEKKILSSNREEQPQNPLTTQREPTQSPKKEGMNMCDTIKCSTCNPSPFVETPEKDQLNQYNHIFDLQHLPVFDENTGEFFWNQNETNWKVARDSILRSEEGGTKSISLNHGSLVSLSTSFINKNHEDNELEQKWIHFKKDGNSNTFIDELNSILKNFEVN